MTSQPTVILFVVSVASMALAAIMSLVAWRVSREERRRSVARVTALADAIQRATARPALDLELRSGSAAGPDLFAPSRHATSGSRVGAAMIGLVVLGGVAALLMTVGRGSASAGRDALESVAGSSARTAAVAPERLDLLALEQQRGGDGLIVRGMVRNPLADAALDHLTAVVSLFRRDGNFKASASALVGSGVLLPGAESGFEVTVPAAGDVARYRVSFRAGDRVVPHVDRRGHGE